MQEAAKDVEGRGASNRDASLVAPLLLAQTAGLELLPGERPALVTLASEANRSLRAFKSAKLVVERLCSSGPAAALAPAVGTATAAVRVTEIGDLCRLWSV